MAEVEDKYITDCETIKFQEFHMGLETQLSL